MMNLFFFFNFPLRNSKFSAVVAFKNHMVIMTLYPLSVLFIIISDYVLSNFPYYLCLKFNPTQAFDT